MRKIIENNNRNITEQNAVSEKRRGSKGVFSSLINSIL